MSSVWLVQSRNASGKDVFAHQKAHLDVDDRLLVVPVAPNAGCWSQGLVEEELPGIYGIVPSPRA